MSLEDDHMGVWKYNFHGGVDMEDGESKKEGALWLPDRVDRVRLLTSYLSAPNAGALIKHLKRFDEPDYSILDLAVPSVCQALSWIKEREWKGRQRHWKGTVHVALSEESLTSYPGIFWRNRGFKDKESVEDEALREYYRMHDMIAQKEKVDARPCAMFGRGKRVQGTLESPFVAERNQGRLVLACDTRDHLMM